jgi:O-antigen ligase
MNTRTIKNQKVLTTVWTVLASVVAFLAILVFAYVLNTNFLIPLVLMGAAVGLVVSLKYPVLPLFVALLVACDVVPFPKGGRAYPAFLLLAISTTIVIAALKSQKIQKFDWKLFTPASILIVTLIWGYFYGVFYLNNYNVYALSEINSIVAWLITPALLMCFSLKNRTSSILKLILITGAIISFVSIFQYATGISFGARVEQLETLGSVDTGVTRATIPAKLFVLFSLFTLIGWITSKRLSLGHTFGVFILLALIGFALLVSFGRALWACAFIGVILTASLLGFRQLVITVISISILGVIGIMLLSVFAPEVLSAAYERVLSVFKEGASNSSFGWRVGENIFAEQSIAKHPILGIGLGGEYKPPLVSSLLFPNQTSYIHNSYYFWAMKLGIWSLLIPLFVVFTLTISGMKRLNTAINPLHKSAIAAGVSCIWAMSLLAITQPEWTSVSSMIFLGCFMALLMQADIQVATEKTKLLDSAQRNLHDDL